MLSGKKGNAQKEAAKKVKPIFPNQGGKRAHVNISGIGILKMLLTKKCCEIFRIFGLRRSSKTPK